MLMGHVFLICRCRTSGLRRGQSSSLLTTRRCISCMSNTLEDLDSCSEARWPISSSSISRKRSSNRYCRKVSCRRSMTESRLKQRRLRVRRRTPWAQRAPRRQARGTGSRSRSCCHNLRTNSCMNRDASERLEIPHGLKTWSQIVGFN